MRFWKASIKGEGHQLIKYDDVPGDNEQEARQTALEYARDDIPWEHWLAKITVDVKFKEDR